MIKEYKRNSQPVNRKLVNPEISFPVMETFYSIQGEGYNTGKAAFFIRLGGCDVGCVWCDVKESWEAGNHATKNISGLVEEVKNSGAQNVVITGGEPCMYNLEELTAELKKNNFNVWLETSGAYSIKGTFDWICVSPKKFKFPMKENLEKADELKVVVYNKSDFDWAEDTKLEIGNWKLEIRNLKLFLQPEYSNFDKVMPLIVDYVKQHAEWGVSLQMHKVIGVR